LAQEKLDLISDFFLFARLKKIRLKESGKEVVIEDSLYIARRTQKNRRELSILNVQK
jgi:hypothetical protein